MGVFDELQVLMNDKAGQLPYRKRVIRIDYLFSKETELGRMREADSRFIKGMEKVLGGGLERHTRAWPR